MISQATCVAEHLRLLPTQPVAQLQHSARQSLKSQRPCEGSEPVHRNVFGSATTSIRWTGSKRNRPMPTNRNFGERTTPSSRAVHRTTARRARWNSLPPCMPEWLPSAANLTRTSPGSHRMGDSCRRHSVTKLLTNLPTARSPLNSCWVRLLARVPRHTAVSSGFSKETRPWVGKKLWSCQALESCQEAWWLLIRAEDQLRGERLALARATRLAAHRTSGGAAHSFDASWSDEFNTVAGDAQFWAAQIRHPAWDFLV